MTSAVVKDAVAKVKARKPHLGALDALRLKRWAEGPSAQLLHLGPYDNERPNIERLHDYIGEMNGRMRGKHHEIYLNDANRTAPERLKTILRQPFSTKES